MNSERYKSTAIVLRKLFDIIISRIFYPPPSVPPPPIANMIEYQIIIYWSFDSSFTRRAIYLLIPANHDAKHHEQYMDEQPLHIIDQIIIIEFSFPQ